MSIKLCECGCGKPAPLAKQTDKLRGYIKDQPLRFIKYHFAPSGKKKTPWEGNYIPVPECGCWIWIGSCNACGYGSIRIGEKTFLAHRISWQKYNGPIPKGMSVLHSCDTPPCINPHHLFIGTQKDNIKDMISKQRGAHNIGIKNHSAKLTEEQVRKIRASSKLSDKKLAKIFKVSAFAVYAARIGKTWKHL